MPSFRQSLSSQRQTDRGTHICVLNATLRLNRIENGKAGVMPAARWLGLRALGGGHGIELVRVEPLHCDSRSAFARQNFAGLTTVFFAFTAFAYSTNMS